jgi:hypothetical protein
MANPELELLNEVQQLPGQTRRNRITRVVISRTVGARLM